MVANYLLEVNLNINKYSTFEVQSKVAIPKAKLPDVSSFQ